ncbi:MAG: endodeoxyribonuclease RusA [Pseudomonadota bacterium]
MKLTLPWPPKELSPNARIHFLAKSRVTKAYRETSYWLADALWRSGRNPCASEGPITLAFTFHPPDRRRRDLDTMLSSVKAGIDGIADALGVNDVRFEYALKRAEPVKNGRVVIVIGSQ